MMSVIVTRPDNKNAIANPSTKRPRGSMNSDPISAGFSINSAPPAKNGAEPIATAEAFASAVTSRALRRSCFRWRTMPLRLASASASAPPVRRCNDSVTTSGGADAVGCALQGLGHLDAEIHLAQRLLKLAADWLRDCRSNKAQGI